MQLSKKFNLDTPEDEIIKGIREIQLDEYSEGSKAIIVNYLLNLMSSKRQNEFNKKIIRSNIYLVLATWAVAIATILIVVYK